MQSRGVDTFRRPEFMLQLEILCDQRIFDSTPFERAISLLLKSRENQVRMQTLLYENRKSCIVFGERVVGRSGGRGGEGNEEQNERKVKDKARKV